MRRTKYRRRSRRGKAGAGRLLLLLLILSGLGAWIGINGFPHGGEQTVQTLGKHYVERALPLSDQSSPSRGGDASRSLSDKDQSSQLDSGPGDGLFHRMIGAVLPAVGAAGEDAHNETVYNESNLSKKQAEEQPEVESQTGTSSPENSPAEQTKPDQPPQAEAAAPKQEASQPEAKADPPAQNTTFVPNPGLTPQVIIYHTHATESYMPVEEGNFHSLGENGTVRQVGDVMAAALEARGIGVIHDKTVHDSPSYNQSYGRSLKTVKKLIADHPTVKIVIDLHRDAAGAGGGPVKTVSIDGQNAARFSLVVGRGNPNYQKLNAFANQIVALTNQIHPSLAGKVIQKEYKYNQYVSDHHLLLEIGNNQNTIQQAEVTGKYFADVLAAALKTM